MAKRSKGLKKRRNVLKQVFALRYRARQGTRQYSNELARNRHGKVKRTIVKLLALLAGQDLLGLRLGDALELEFGPQRLRSRFSQLRSRNELGTCKTELQNEARQDHPSFEALSGRKTEGKRNEPVQTIIWPRTSSPSPCGPLDVRMVARSRATSPRATLQGGEKVNLLQTSFALPRGPVRRDMAQLTEQTCGRGRSGSAADPLPELASSLAEVATRSRKSVRGSIRSS